VLIKTIKDASFRVPRVEVAQHGGVKERTSYVNVFYEFQAGNEEIKRETSWYDTGVVVLKGVWWKYLV
jgi:hypothetical protein